MLHVRCARLVEIAARLPRWSDRLDMGYQWISLFLESERVGCDTVMRPFAVDILARAAKPGDAIPGGPLLQESIERQCLRIDAAMQRPCARSSRRRCCLPLRKDMSSQAARSGPFFSPARSFRLSIPAG
jgi:hypothetical protein